jgi:hypothetical protein
MTKVIELLLRADHNVTSEDLYRSDRFRWRASTKKLLKQAIDLLQAAPRWETPEQYKKRTGEDWPDEAAVYRLYTDNDGITKWYADSLTRSTTHNNRYKLLPVVCATIAGPPPADWKPEENSK